MHRFPLIVCQGHSASQWRSSNELDGFGGATSPAIRLEIRWGFRLSRLVLIQPELSKQHAPSRINSRGPSPLRRLSVRKIRVLDGGLPKTSVLLSLCGCKAQMAVS